MGLVDDKDLRSTYKYDKIFNNFKKRLCIICAFVCIKKNKKLKGFEMTGETTWRVDLKSLPLAECQFESGRGHH